MTPTGKSEPEKVTSKSAPKAEAKAEAKGGGVGQEPYSTNDVEPVPTDTVVVDPPLTTNDIEPLEAAAYPGNEPAITTHETYNP